MRSTLGVGDAGAVVGDGVDDRAVARPHVTTRVAARSGRRSRSPARGSARRGRTVATRPGRAGRRHLDVDAARRRQVGAARRGRARPPRPRRRCRGPSAPPRGPRQERVDERSICSAPSSTRRSASRSSVAALVPQRELGLGAHPASGVRSSCEISAEKRCSWRRLAATRSSRPSSVAASAVSSSRGAPSAEAAVEVVLAPVRRLRGHVGHGPQRQRRPPARDQRDRDEEHARRASSEADQREVLRVLVGGQRDAGDDRPDAAVRRRRPGPLAGACPARAARACAAGPPTASAAAPVESPVGARALEQPARRRPTRWLSSAA